MLLVAKKVEMVAGVVLGSGEPTAAIDVVVICS